MMRQFLLYSKLLWTIHFYKEYWIATLVEWTVVLGIAVYLIRQKALPWTKLILYIAAIQLAAIHSLILNYYAPRAIHGAVVLKGLLIGILLTEALTRIQRKWVSVFLVSVLFLNYSFQTAHVMSIRRFNANYLSDLESTWVQKMKTCQEPCQLVYGDLAEGFKRDWIMVPLYYEFYLKWIQSKHNISKEIHFLPLSPKH